jgi:hypothetical protein
MAGFIGILAGGSWLLLGLLFGMSVANTLFAFMIIMALSAMFFRMMIGWLALIGLIVIVFSALIGRRIKGKRYAVHHQWFTAFIIGVTLTQSASFLLFDSTVYLGAVMTVPFVLGVILLSAVIAHSLAHDELSKPDRSKITLSEAPLLISLFSVLVLSLILILPNLSAVAGLEPKPPPRPESGYGSGTMPYEVKSFSREVSYSHEISEWWLGAESTRNWKVHIFLPMNYDSQDTGLAIFLHGFGGTNVENYVDTMNSLAGQGLVAIFPEYASKVDYSSVADDFEMIHFQGGTNDPAHLPRYTMALEGIDAALQFIETDSEIISTLGNTSIDRSHLWIGGHSMGVGTTFYVVGKALQRGWGDESLVINLEAPWIHAEDSELRGNMSLLPDHALINVVEYEGDTTVAKCLGRWHHERLITRDNSTVLADEQVRFIVVQNDYHGFPPLVASHFQQISFVRDTLANIAYYPRIEAQSDYISSMAISDPAGAKTARNAFMESNGEAVVTGTWSDGTPVNPLLYISEPLLAEGVDWKACSS